MEKRDFNGNLRLAVKLVGVNPLLPLHHRFIMFCSDVLLTFHLPRFWLLTTNPGIKSFLNIKTNIDYIQCSFSIGLEFW